MMEDWLGELIIHLFSFNDAIINSSSPKCTGFVNDFKLRNEWSNHNKERFAYSYDSFGSCKEVQGNFKNVVSIDGEYKEQPTSIRINFNSYHVPYIGDLKLLSVTDKEFSIEFQINQIDLINTKRVFPPKGPPIFYSD